MAFGYGNGRDPKGYGSPFEGRSVDSVPVHDQNIARYGESIGQRMNHPEITKIIGDHYMAQANKRTRQLNAKQPRQAFGYHNGGIVQNYHNGGPVNPAMNYQPMNPNMNSTDTVPAMLTPGEVVLNRQQQQQMGNLMANGGRVSQGGMQGAAEAFKQIGVPGYQGGGHVGSGYQGSNPLTAQILHNQWMGAGGDTSQPDLSQIPEQHSGTILSGADYQGSNPLTQQILDNQSMGEQQFDPNDLNQDGVVNVQDIILKQNQQQVTPESVLAGESGYQGSNALTQQILANQSMGGDVGDIVRHQGEVQSMANQALGIDPESVNQNMQAMADFDPLDSESTAMHQEALNAAGYTDDNGEPIVVDGQFGPQTAGASVELNQDLDSLNANAMAAGDPQGVLATQNQPEGGGEWANDATNMTIEDLQQEIQNGNPNFNVTDIVKKQQQGEPLSQPEQPEIQDQPEQVEIQDQPEQTGSQEWISDSTGMTVEEIADQINQDNPNFDITDIAKKQNEISAFQELHGLSDSQNQTLPQEAPEPNLFSQLFSGSASESMGNLFSLFQHFSQMAGGGSQPLAQGVSAQGGMTQAGGVTDTGGITHADIAPTIQTQQADFTTGGVGTTSVPTYGSNINQGNWAAGTGPFGSGQGYNPVQQYMTQGQPVDAYGNPINI